MSEKQWNRVRVTRTYVHPDRGPQQESTEWSREAHERSLRQAAEEQGNELPEGWSYETFNRDVLEHAQTLSRLPVFPKTGNTGVVEIIPAASVLKVTVEVLDPIGIELA